MISTSRMHAIKCSSMLSMNVKKFSLFQKYKHPHTNWLQHQKKGIYFHNIDKLAKVYHWQVVINYSSWRQFAST